MAILLFGIQLGGSDATSSSRSKYGGVTHIYEDYTTHFFTLGSVAEGQAEITVIKSQKKMIFDPKYNSHIQHFLNENYDDSFFESNLLVLIYLETWAQKHNSELNIALGDEKNTVTLYSKKLSGPMLCMMNPFLFVIELNSDICRSQNFVLNRIMID